LGELDDEFSDAYLKLFQYGKNKNEMLLPLTYVSLQFFLPLQDKAETQALQVGHFARVLSAANAAPHVDLMRQSGLLPFICADLAARGYTLSPYSTQACTAAAAQAAQ